MRCNVGVAPIYLPDQMLIAEQVELLMIGGMLRKNNFEPKSDIPPTFRLGKGHMLFWVDKLAYLRRRHSEVKYEVRKRGFKVTDKELVLEDYPEKFRNDWNPTLDDSLKLRERLIWKLNNKPNIWRYRGNYIHVDDVEVFKHCIKNSRLFYV